LVKEDDMKRLLGSVFAMAMVFGVPALAAPSDFSNQKLAQGSQDDQRGRQRGGEARGEQGPAQGAPNRESQGDNRGRGERGGAQNAGPPAAQTAPNRGLHEGDRRPAQTARGRGNSGRQVEHGPSQFEKRAFQRNVMSARRFRAGTYRAPQGWRYTRWTFGQSLPRAFWAQPYWITNFWLYDLDRPPFGCEWVRFGPDALLVDTSSGEILEAEYNVFY
jgi:Ni/Co efflux regulator RcnB